MRCGIPRFGRGFLDVAERDLLDRAHQTIPQEGAEPLPSGLTSNQTLPSVLAGRYEVRDVLGRGGMGVVLRAYDRTLAAEVAIKLVRPELAPERRWAERLAREVKLARQIHHPNVCRVFDFQQAEGFAFLIMDLAIRTLGMEIASGTFRGRSCAERMAAAEAVATGLAAIHDAGIVHGDLTPHNVLRMPDGRLVVADFGMATDSFDSTTVQGGTLAYMAPEIYAGGRASFASDVWSLGIVVHEIVFGERPTWLGTIPGRRMRRPSLSTAEESRALGISRRLAAHAIDSRPGNGCTAVHLFGRNSLGYRSRQ